MQILNTREIKKLLIEIEQIYNIGNLKLEYIFLKNNKNKVFILSKDFKDLDTKKLHVNNLGLYFCKIETDGIRLSIEGSQLIGNKSDKNINLNKTEVGEWVRGEDIKKNNENGYFIIKHNGDFYGTTKVKNNILRNFIPKHRRIRK